jgi:hypothetical protein
MEDGSVRFAWLWACRIGSRSVLRAAAISFENDLWRAGRSEGRENRGNLVRLILGEASFLKVGVDRVSVMLYGRFVVVSEGDEERRKLVTRNGDGELPEVRKLNARAARSEELQELVVGRWGGMLRIGHGGGG